MLLAASPIFWLYSAMSASAVSAADPIAKPLPVAAVVFLIGLAGLAFLVGRPVGALSRR